MSGKESIQEIISGVIAGLKQKLIIMPKFEEKTFPDYKLVPKNVEYEVPVPVKKEVPYEVKVPELRQVVQEVTVQSVKIKEVIKEVSIPELKPYPVETFSVQDISRMKELIEMLPRVLEALDKIVKYIPREVPFDVQKPVVKEVPYEVKVPEFINTPVARPVFHDVKIPHPVIVEEVMTLEEWKVLSEKQKAQVGEIIKEQLRNKEKS